MISWPDHLVSDIARRHSVIVLGSGISRGCTNANGRQPKTWREFLEHADGLDSQAYVRRLIKRADYLTACELIKKKLGDDPFNSLIIDEFLTPGYHAGLLHQHIFKLDSRIVATPNFDKIYETYANAEAHGSIRIKYHSEADIAEAIRRKDRLILKIHGTVDSPHNMIFTRREYAEARSSYHRFYALLEALCLTHTFLFLGCGVSDPDIRLLLEDNLFRYPHSRPHQIVLPKRSVHKDEIGVIEATMNLKVLMYSATNNHIELTESLADLVSRVEGERANLRDNSNW